MTLKGNGVNKYLNFNVFSFLIVYLINTINTITFLDQKKISIINCCAEAEIHERLIISYVFSNHCNAHSHDELFTVEISCKFR
jgi:hypothetical protein